MRLSCTVFELSTKVANFNPPHLHPVRIPLWSLASENVPGLSCDLRNPTFSHFDTIPECDKHTHTHTHTRRRHIPR